MTSYQHDVPAGAGWSLVVPRGHTVRLEALADGANVSMLCYSAAQPLERLNVPDTLKAQMSARIVPPMVLMSDLGRALCSVVESTCDWHDAVCGFSNDVSRYGPSSYAADGNEWRRSAWELFGDELATLGLGPRDLHACVNWFSKVAPSDDGSLSFVTGHSRIGDSVTLRTEQDVLILLATVPHPMDPAIRWSPSGVRVVVAQDAPVAAASREFRAESERALIGAERSVC